jgi:hypothetical protein
MLVVALFVSGEALSSHLQASSGGEMCVMSDWGPRYIFFGLLCSSENGLGNNAEVMFIESYCPVLVKFIHQVSVLV